MTLRRFLGESGVLVGLVLVALVFGLLIGPQFFRAGNLELMARQTAIVCVAAFGMTMVIVSGGIDLSVGSIIALSTVIDRRWCCARMPARRRGARGDRRRDGVRRRQRLARDAPPGRALHRHARDDAAGARRGEGIG